MPHALAEKVGQVRVAVQPRNQRVLRGDPGGADALITAESMYVLNDSHESSRNERTFSAQSSGKIRLLPTYGVGEDTPLGREFRG